MCLGSDDLRLRTDSADEALDELRVPALGAIVAPCLYAIHTHEGYRCANLQIELGLDDWLDMMLRIWLNSLSFSLLIICIRSKQTLLIQQTYRFP